MDPTISNGGARNEDGPQNEDTRSDEANGGEESETSRPPLTVDTKRRLTCPIAGEIMSDPVSLLQMEGTFDRESLCEWLVNNPTRHPITNVDCGEMLRYDDDIETRELLIEYLGHDAYRRYDDSYLRPSHDATSTVLSAFSLYEKEFSVLLYGMGRGTIDWLMAQRKVQADDQNDPVVLGLKALLYHPRFFANYHLTKNESAFRNFWLRAEELGLSDMAEAGDLFAQWLKGMFLDVVEHDLDEAMHFYRRAADRGHAFAQCSLGTLFEDDEDSERAEDYYLRSAKQGNALAQYNLAMLYEPDFELSRPYFEQAADQGHAEALYYLGSIYMDSDVVERDSKTANDYFERAAIQGSTEARDKLAELFTACRKKSTAQSRPHINIPPKGIGPIVPGFRNEIDLGHSFGDEAAADDPSRAPALAPVPSQPTENDNTSTYAASAPLHYTVHDQGDWMPGAKHRQHSAPMSFQYHHHPDEIFTSTCLSSRTILSTITGLSGLSGAHQAEASGTRPSSGSLRFGQLSDMTTSMMSFRKLPGPRRSHSLPELSSFAALMEEEPMPEELRQTVRIMNSEPRGSSGTGMSSSSGNVRPVPGLPPPPRNRAASTRSVMSWASAYSQRSRENIHIDHSFSSSTRSVLSDLSAEINALDHAPTSIS